MSNINDIHKHIEKYFANIISLFHSETEKWNDLTKQLDNVKEVKEKEKIELEDEINKISVKVNNLNLVYEDLTKTYHNKINERNNLQKEQENLEEQCNSLSTEYEKYKEKCLNIKKKMKLSACDQKILDLSRKKLDLYSQMTNVVWDYSVPLGSGVVGYIKSKENNYLNAFEFKDTVAPNELEEKIWKEIEDGTEIWSDILDMVK